MHNESYYHCISHVAAKLSNNKLKPLLKKSSSKPETVPQDHRLTTSAFRFILPDLISKKDPLQGFLSPVYQSAAKILFRRGPSWIGELAIFSQHSDVLAEYIASSRTPKVFGAAFSISKYRVYPFGHAESPMDAIARSQAQTRAYTRAHRGPLGVCPAEV